MTELRKNIDRAHSLLVRLIWRKCVVCGSQRNLECGHLLSRSSESTRWDTDVNGGNCAAQCSMCNTDHERDGAPYLGWFVLRNGAEAYAALLNRWSTSTQGFTDDQLRDMLNAFELRILGLYGYWSALTEWLPLRDADHAYISELKQEYPIRTTWIWPTYEERDIDANFYRRKERVE